MKKVFIFLAFMALILVGCKDETDDVYYDVTISGLSATAKSSKIIAENSDQPFRAPSEEIICLDYKASYAKYKLNGGAWQKMDVFEVLGQSWTSSIKLSAGNHILNEFLLFNDNNTPEDDSDDILLSATPHSGSQHSSYLSSPELALERVIEVGEGKKNKLDIETVCFQEKDYEKFGFSYFKLTQLKVRPLYFFVNFCIKEKSDYAGSLYSLQSNWTSGTGFIDVPGIIKIEVWRNGNLMNTFSNTFEGEKLTVNYVDYEGVIDSYELKLFILVRNGPNVEYVHFKTFSFQDISNISEGGDGIIDGVLGGCYDKNSPPDFILPGWMNIPLQVNYKLISQTSSDSYFRALLADVPAGYEITNGEFSTFCGDHNTFINLNQFYLMNVYNTLYIDNLPSFINKEKWQKINWLINHLHYFPGYTWKDIQQLIWLYDAPAWNGQTHGIIPALTSIAADMKNKADQYGPGYQVLPGGWACVLFTNSETVQPAIMMVDP